MNILYGYTCIVSWDGPTKPTVHLGRGIAKTHGIRTIAFGTLQETIFGIARREFIPKWRAANLLTRITINFVPVPETDQEMEELSKSLKGTERLIVVMHDPSSGDASLIGPIVTGKPRLYPLPGALLSENGYLTYASTQLGHACYVAKEASHDGTKPVSLAIYSVQPVRFPKLQPST